MQSVERRQITPELVAHFPRPGMAIPGKVHYSPDSNFVTYLSARAAICSATSGGSTLQAEIKNIG